MSTPTFTATISASMLAIGLIELGCLLLYLFPRTGVLGAVLLTGLLGGAIATQVRVAADSNDI